MNIGIVNFVMLEVYDDILKDLLEWVEDVILNRREDVIERLFEFVEIVKGIKEEKKVDLFWCEEFL